MLSTNYPVIELLYDLSISLSHHLLSYISDHMVWLHCTLVLLRLLSVEKLIFDVFLLPSFTLLYLPWKYLDIIQCYVNTWPVIHRNKQKISPRIPPRPRKDKKYNFFRLFDITELKTSNRHKGILVHVLNHIMLFVCCFLPQCTHGKRASSLVSHIS